MEDRTRRILLGLVFAAGAIAVSASTAGAQSSSSSGSNSPAPKTSTPFDDGPTSGSSAGSMPGGCSGVHMPDDGGTGSTGAAAQLT
jgi:hypothetical protein